MRAKIVIVQANESLIDIAIREYQSVEGTFLIMITNSKVVPSITADIAPGTPLSIWPLRVVKEVAEKTESLTPYLPIIMQWIMSSGGTTGGGSGGNEWNDGDYLHTRGDETATGVKTLIDGVRTNVIEEIGNEGLSLEGVKIKDDVIDMGTW